MIDISKEIQAQELINKTAKEIANKLKEMTYLDETLETPKHYDNSKGTLYKVATERLELLSFLTWLKDQKELKKKVEFKSDLEKVLMLLNYGLQEYEK